MLKIINLHATRDDKPILQGVNLDIKPGEVHALMGPNGSGKSTLAYALAGHPSVKVIDGEVHLDDIDLLSQDVSDRALSGLFSAFQYPVEVAGVSYLEFLRLSYNNINKQRLGESYRSISPYKFKKVVEDKMSKFKMDTSFLARNVNEGFSGGEKKKSEILQMAVLEPKYAVLDETDSGLDVTALKIVAEGARQISKENNTGILVITHYNRILKYLVPDFVHVFIEGKVVKSGSKDLAHELDENGYDNFLSNK